MARRPPPPPDPRPAIIDRARIQPSIAKLERRIEELRTADPKNAGGDFSSVANSLCTKVNSTLVDIFGPDTIEYRRAQVHPTRFSVGYISLTGEIPFHEKVEAFNTARERER